MFYTYVAIVCSKCFNCFSLYVAISVFMLQVASVLSGCCIYFIHMLQVHVPNVSFASDLCCIQVFHVASVSCFRGIWYVQRVVGARPGRWGKGHDVPGLADGAGAPPGVLLMRRGSPRPGFRVLSA